MDFLWISHGCLMDVSWVYYEFLMDTFLKDVLLISGGLLLIQHRGYKGCVCVCVYVCVCVCVCVV